MPDKYPVQPDDLAPSTDEEERLQIRQQDVPQGPIHDYPDIRRARRFAFAIPMILLLMALTFLAELAVLFAGWQGALHSDYEVWYAGIPILTVLAVVAGALAASGGWLKDRATGPLRPIFYGLTAGLSVVFVGLAVMALVTVTTG